jgi:hypothetical protein
LCATQIEALAKQDEDCKRLTGTPGVGPLVASAVALRSVMAAFIFHASNEQRDATPTDAAEDCPVGWRNLLWHET